MGGLWPYSNAKTQMPFSQQETAVKPSSSQGIPAFLEAKQNVAVTVGACQLGQDRGLVLVPRNGGHELHLLSTL